LQAIINSYEDCPQFVHQLCHHLQEETMKKFSKHNSIGGYVFLRFLCPAITTPEAYKIVDEVPSPDARRSFILITKVLQNMANGVKFTESEEFMCFLNDFVEENTPKVVGFMSQLAILENYEELPPPLEGLNDQQLGELRQHIIMIKDKVLGRLNQPNSIPTEN